MIPPPVPLLISSVACTGLAVASLILLRRRVPSVPGSLPPILALFLLLLPIVPALPSWTHCGFPSPLLTPSSSTQFLHPLSSIWIVLSGLLALRLLRRARRACSMAQAPFSRPLQNLAILQSAASCCREIGLRRIPHIRLCPDRRSPCIAGFLCQTLYLPQSAESWSGDALRMILLHELNHARRRDPAARLIIEILLVLHWWNPFAWILRRVFLDASEDSCDRRVLEAGFAPRRYAACLIDIATGSSRSPALHAALGSDTQLASRIRRILGHSPASPTPCKRVHAGAAAVVCLLLITLTLACRDWLSPDLRQRQNDPASRFRETSLRLSADPFPGNGF